MDVDALELLLSQSLEEKTRKRGNYVSAACEYCKTKHLRYVHRRFFPPLAEIDCACKLIRTMVWIDVEVRNQCVELA